jgi:hypothetical protein
MLMPETAMYKNDFFEPGKYEVGSTWEIGAM